MSGVLNMPKFWIWQSSEDGEYAKTCRERVLIIFRVPNIPGFWIWYSEYVRITQASKYAKI